MNQEEFIEQEVQRKLSQQQAQHSEEVGSLKGIIKDQQEKLIIQNDTLRRMTAMPLCFGTIHTINDKPDINLFGKGDEIVVVDKSSSYHQKMGKIVGEIGKDGNVVVLLNNGIEETFSIGLGNQAQIRLVNKSDGTYAVVSIDGKPWEVQGVPPELNLSVGDPVKVNPENKQIVSKGYDLHHGPVCEVIAINEFGIEVSDKSEKRLAQNSRNFDLEEGDRVVLDPGMFIITEKLPKDSRNRYIIDHDLEATWDSIGGLKQSKKDFKNALELPFKYPELYKHYGEKRTAGFLFHGPPGCGKTLFAKAGAHALAEIHGKSAMEGGYIFVKSPEILDKWVGNSEAEIRSLFDKGRRHYKEHGYPALLVFDEAEAIMGQRGISRSSSINETLVPMFLGEMDGVDSQQTKYNPIVLLMTNRPNVLDPAITRPGRISHHIYVNRPEIEDSIDILKIHTKNIPFEKESDRDFILNFATSEIFSKSRLLYKINGEYDFTFSDIINGAMLEAIAEGAKSNAISRDIKFDTKTGVNLEDFKNSIEKIYKEQSKLNHSFDLEDFADKHHLQLDKMNVDRSYSSI